MSGSPEKLTEREQIVASIEDAMRRCNWIQDSTSLKFDRPHQSDHGLGSAEADLAYWQDRLANFDTKEKEMSETQGATTKQTTYPDKQFFTATAREQEDGRPTVDLYLPPHPDNLGTDYHLLNADEAESLGLALIGQAAVARQLVNPRGSVASAALRG